MKHKYVIILSLIFCTQFFALKILAFQETDSVPKKQYKNVIRYNLSGALLFGVDRYIVFGFERVIRPNQSISINAGKVSLPKFVEVITDSLQLSKDKKSSGFNLSLDYRFYLAKENKYPAPHGLYIGPYYSFNRFNRDNEWKYIKGTANNYVTTESKFDIHTVGFELGYQLILWERLAIDLLLVGPGVGVYTYNATFDNNLDPATKEQLLEGLQQLITQKFPGMNYVIADKKLSGNGTLKTTSLGYRYIIQIGFNF